MPTCNPPPLEADSGLRWRLLATIDPADEEEENQQSWLPLDLSPDYSPPTIGYLEQGFVEIEHLYTFEFTTSLGALTVELKEQFVPTRIDWKRYTQDKDTLITTSTDETIVLTVDDPNHTWPLEIPTVSGTTNGEWDGDFVIHERV